MKTYRGYYFGPGVPTLVTVTDDDADSRKTSVMPLNPRFDLRDHSPDGFGWGYGGSGPAQLALALLLDATGDEEKSLRYYQEFKSAYVAKIQREADWSMTESEILADLRRVEAATIARRMERFSWGPGDVEHH